MYYGINSWAFQLPVNQGNLDELLDKIDALEIQGERRAIQVFASPEPDDLEFAKFLSQRAGERGYIVETCGFTPFEDENGNAFPHLLSPDEAERGLALKRVLGFVDFAGEAAVEGDQGVLTGPWHIRHKYFTEKDKLFLVEYNSGIKNFFKEGKNIFKF